MPHGVRTEVPASTADVAQRPKCVTKAPFAAAPGKYVATASALTLRSTRPTAARAATSAQLGRNANRASALIPLTRATSPGATARRSRIVALSKVWDVVSTLKQGEFAPDGSDRIRTARQRGTHTAGTMRQNDGRSEALSAFAVGQRLSLENNPMNESRNGGVGHPEGCPAPCFSPSGWGYRLSAQRRQWYEAWRSSPCSSTYPTNTQPSRQAQGRSRQA